MSRIYVGSESIVGRHYTGLSGARTRRAPACAAPWDRCGVGIVDGAGRADEGCGLPLLHPADVPVVPGSGDSAGEQALLENGVNAPIAVDDLGNAEVDRNRHQ